MSEIFRAVTDTTEPGEKAKAGDMGGFTPDHALTLLESQDINNMLECPEQVAMLADKHPSILEAYRALADYANSDTAETKEGCI